MPCDRSRQKYGRISTPLLAVLRKKRLFKGNIFYIMLARSTAPVSFITWNHIGMIQDALNGISSRHIQTARERAVAYPTIKHTTPRPTNTLTNTVLVLRRTWDGTAQPVLPHHLTPRLQSPISLFTHHLLNPSHPHRYRLIICCAKWPFSIIGRSFLLQITTSVSIIFYSAPQQPLFSAEHARFIASILTWAHSTAAR